jgi:hypothetical protein
LTTLQVEDSSVMGLTILDNKLFIVCSKSDTIHVYAAQPPYTQLTNIHVNGLKSPQDIAACTINSCLYVADSCSQCVWKVKTDHKVDRWLDVENTASLSVTWNGHIVVLTAVDVQGRGVSRTWLGTVEVYHTDGYILSVMKLPRDIVNPWRVIQSVNKSFIVCHGDRATKLNRVCEVNTAGDIVKSYGGLRGSQPGQLSTPRHFMLDHMEQIFVVDFGNHQVLLLNRELEIKRLLLCWTNDCPLAVFYDQQATQLVIALLSGKIEVHSLRLLSRH